MLFDLKAAEAERCKRSLAYFVKKAWPHIERGVPLVWGPHMEAICMHLQALYEGRLGKRNLAIGVPPRTSKTTLVSVMFPCWVWSKDPSYKFMTASGAERVMDESSRKTRELLKSDWYQETFLPDWQFQKDQDQAQSFKNTKHGQMRGVTINGSFTGLGANCLEIDDPNQITTANSKAERDRVIHSYSEGFAWRLNNPETGIRIMIMQRTHEEDLMGWILANQPDLWCFLTLPMEFDPARKCVTPIFEDWRKEEGELLCPERFGPDIIKEIKSSMSSSAYAAQYAQLPQDAEGELFKRGDAKGNPYVRLYSKDGLKNTTFKRIIMSIDPAFKKGEDNDPSGFLVVGETEKDGFWILDNRTKKMSFSELENDIVLAAAHWKPSTIVIESNAHGEALVQRLGQTSNLPISPVFKNKDKVFYANLHAVPLWENGKIWLPDFEDWTQPFLDELYGFPKVVHDDQVDALSQALNHLIDAGDPYAGFFEMIADDLSSLNP